MKNEDRKKRNIEIYKMRKDRYTLREIGEKFGITKARVAQICDMLEMKENICKNTK